MNNLTKYAKNNLKTNLSNETVDKFNAYLDLILTWNKKISLTAIKTPEEIVIKHFIDSLTCFQIIPMQGKFSMIDIGTGAGFPGIPLKLINPQINLTLIESVSKKADFCKTAVEQLNLSNVQIINLRAEEVGKDFKHREQYRFAVARAVAPLPVLVEYLLPFVKIGGSAIAMKGSNIESEGANAENAVKILGGEALNPIYFSLPENFGKRCLIEMRKVKITPLEYPRRPGIASKKPIR